MRFCAEKLCSQVEKWQSTCLKSIVGIVGRCTTSLTVHILIMQGLIEGTNDTVTPWVCDVRDIARAHVLAVEVPSAKGR